MGLFEFLAGVNGVLDALGAPDPDEEARQKAEAQRVANEKRRKRQQYSRDTWVCPKCKNTNYGGEQCRVCRNGNPNIPSNLW